MTDEDPLVSRPSMLLALDEEIEILIFFFFFFSAAVGKLPFP